MSEIESGTTDLPFFKAIALNIRNLPKAASWTALLSGFLVVFVSTTGPIAILYQAAAAADMPIELTNSFTNFAKECIKYIKIKELELEDPLNHNEDETMFENCDDIEQKIKDSNKSNSNFTISSDDDEDAINSLWGDGAVKYDMKMFARRKR